MKLAWKKRIYDLNAKEEERWRKRKGPGAKRYFDDFEVQTVLGKNGKSKRQLVYIGDTYTPQLSEGTFRLRKKLFFALALVCAAMFVLSNGINVASNRYGLLAALGVLEVIPLFLVVYSCIYRLRKPQTLQRTEYVEASMFLKFGAFFSSLLGSVLFVWHLVFALGNALPQEAAGEALVCTGWGVMAGCSIYLWIAELRTAYIQRDRDGEIVRREHFKRNGG